MNLQNTEKLLVTYPLLYRKLREWGFECEDGWYALVWQLSKDIETEARREGIPERPDTWPAITILKQKFGSLRVSFDNTTMVSDPLRALKEKAFERSLEICEHCGAPVVRINTHTKSGWVETLCATCQKLKPEPHEKHEATPIPVWLKLKNNPPH